MAACIKLKLYYAVPAHFITGVYIATLLHLFQIEVMLTSKYIASASINGLFKSLELHCIIIILWKSI